jgi:hypothetical protein
VVTRLLLSVARGILYIHPRAQTPPMLRRTVVLTRPLNCEVEHSEYFYVH